MACTGSATTRPMPPGRILFSRREKREISWSIYPDGRGPWWMRLRSVAGYPPFSLPIEMILVTRNATQRILAPQFGSIAPTVTARLLPIICSKGKHRPLFPKTCSPSPSRGTQRAVSYISSTIDVSSRENSLAWSFEAGDLMAWRDFCWYSWTEQIKSLKKLFDYSFEWVCAGHGGSKGLPAAEMNRRLRAMIGRLETDEIRS